MTENIYPPTFKSRRGIVLTVPSLRGEWPSGARHGGCPMSRIYFNRLGPPTAGANSSCKPNSYRGRRVSSVTAFLRFNRGKEIGILPPWRRDPELQRRPRLRFRGRIAQSAPGRGSVAHLALAHPNLRVEFLSLGLCKSSRLLRHKSLEGPPSFTSLAFPLLPE